jgi:hypothetical protein
LSPQHITIRVPWHDTDWTGRVCAAPSANTACIALSRIAKNKRPDQDDYAGQNFGDLEQAQLPPCVEERAGFMSQHDLILKKEQPYKARSPETHGHFAETSLRLEAYSAACVPFGSMLRRQVEGDDRKKIVGKADALRLGYDPARKPELPFDTSWIQDKRNQLIMLDTFFGAVQPETSLCLFYAKRTPLAEDSRRVIMGVGRVKGIGHSTEYAYAGAGPLKGVLWERCVRHSLRPGNKLDGFLMPYHELLAAETDPSLDLSACVAFAPDDSFDAYSDATEHLGDDATISCCCFVAEGRLRVQHVPPAAPSPLPTSGAVQGAAACLAGRRRTCRCRGRGHARPRQRLVPAGRA